MTEPFRMITPINSSLADDEDALAAYELEMPALWRELLDAAHGTPAGDPSVTREPNPHYGQRIGTYDNGDPIIDHHRLFLITIGPAIRRPAADHQPAASARSAEAGAGSEAAGSAEAGPP